MIIGIVITSNNWIRAVRDGIAKGAAQGNKAKGAVGTQKVNDFQ